jgi:hypothetical protein
MMERFAALLMSQFWPVASFRGHAHFGRFRIEADMDRKAKRAGSVENDPSATSKAVFACDQSLILNSLGKAEISRYVSSPSITPNQTCLFSVRRRVGDACALANAACGKLRQNGRN